MLDELNSFYSNKKILVTGHTGFKGGWLVHWLEQFGATEIIGAALAPDQGPDNLFDQSNVGSLCKSYFQDIRDFEGILKIFKTHQPEIVFHLAAQPLVIAGYERPLETYETNVMGTANILEAARITPSVKSCVCVTTDKVYENKEWPRPYREDDVLGDKDPYSASKAASEMVAKSYMSAMLPTDRPYGLATARGGNVIGGGDWSENRIVPDIVRSIANDVPLTLRNPASVRPWQHALELCYGYSCLAYRLHQGWGERDLVGTDFIGSWNFGPSSSDEIPVSKLVDIALDVWDKPDFNVVLGNAKFREAGLLRLDSSKAISKLGWHPVLKATEAISWTADWYMSYLSKNSLAMTKTGEQVQEFARLIDKAKVSDINV